METKLYEIAGYKRIRNFEDLVAWHRGHQEGWLYRGQSGRWHELVSSLERTFKELLIQPMDYLHREDAIIREFQRKAHLFSERVPGKEDTLGWLALMQHYGAPTRLLDCTYSPFVAAFFAIDSIDQVKGATIWAVDMNWLQRVGNKRLRGKRNAYVGGVYWDKHPPSFRKYLMAHSQPAVFPVNPIQLNDRLMYQQGVFLCPSRIDSTFENNLLSMGPTQDQIVRLYIRFKDHIDIVKWLIRTNVGWTSLFPGLQGFAKSLKWQVLLPFMNKMW